MTITVTHQGKLIYETTGPWTIRILTSRTHNILVAVSGTQDRAVLDHLLSQIQAIVGETDVVLSGPPFRHRPGGGA